MPFGERSRIQSGRLMEEAGIATRAAETKQAQTSSHRPSRNPQSPLARWTGRARTAAAAITYDHSIPLTACITSPYHDL